MAEDWFKKLAGKWFDRVTGVKFRGGIVGRLILVPLGILVVLGIICWKFPMWWIPFVALAGAAMACYVALQILEFAKKHPLIALFEGSELLTWQKQAMAQKGKGTLVDTGSTVEPPEWELLNPEEVKLLDLPDKPPGDTKS
jgi:hypothetical protein